MGNLPSSQMKGAKILIESLKKAEVEYIFVNPIFRKKGIAKKLLNLVKDKTGKKPIPQDPISPLGKKLFKII